MVPQQLTEGEAKVQAGTKLRCEPPGDEDPTADIYASVDSDDIIGSLPLIDWIAHGITNWLHPIAKVGCDDAYGRAPKGRVRQKQSAFSHGAK